MNDLPFYFREFTPKEFFDAAYSFETCMRDDSSHLSYLFGYLADEEVNAESMMVEGEYVDADFLDDYAHYYVKCYKPYSRFCKRIHFFTDITKDELEDLFNNYLEGSVSKGAMQDELSKKYLGFIIIKPLPVTIIGRTALVPYSDTKQDGDDEPDRRSIRCLRPYSVNILGVPLTVKTIAYLEQDKVIAACATSALWCAFQKAAHSNGYHIPTLYEITDYATMYSTTRRPIPSTGLNGDQMCRAIKAVGLEPEFWRMRENDGRCVGLLLASTYAYLRGGMPVVAMVEIVGEGGHAITLTGYRLQDGQLYDEVKLASLDLEGEPIDMRLVGSRIEALYSHDDAVGPFCRADISLMKQVENEDGTVQTTIHIDPNDIGKNGEREIIVPFMYGPWDREDEDGKKITIPIIPFALVAPLYHKIRVPFLTILYHAGRMDRIIKRYNPGVPLEWDIFITSVNDYKGDIAGRDDIPPDIRKKLLGSLHPRFIWRARAFIYAEEVCELLADATDMELSFQVYTISLFNKNLRKNIEDNYEKMYADYRGDRKTQLLILKAAGKNEADVKKL